MSEERVQNEEDRDAMLEILDKMRHRVMRGEVVGIYLLATKSNSAGLDYQAGAISSKSILVLQHRATQFTVEWAVQTMKSAEEGPSLTIAQETDD